MKTRAFRYALDPLCVGACALYAANRFLIKPHVGSGFFHSYFNDVLVIPAALPLLLWAYWKCGWRRVDAMPTLREVAAHTAIWAVICEGIGPRFWPRYGVADAWDVVAYAAGAGAAWSFWNRKSIGRRTRATTEATR